MKTLIDRTLSVGLLHAAASELLIRRAMQMHEAQGMRLRHEAKRALTYFNEAYKRFARAYDRLQELATDKNIDKDTAALFDAFLNDSARWRWYQCCILTPQTRATRIVRRIARIF